MLWLLLASFIGAVALFILWAIVCGIVAAFTYLGLMWGFVILFGTLFVPIAAWRVGKWADDINLVDKLID